MARRGYPPEFRRRVVNRVEGGRKVSEVAAELEVSEQTIYTWRRQARIDAGLEAGVTTPEQQPSHANSTSSQPGSSLGEIGIPSPTTMLRPSSQPAGTDRGERGDCAR